MRNQVVCGLGVLAVFLGTWVSQAGAAPLAHVVFFKLKESTPDQREQLLGGCRRFLSEHEGTVYFAAGVLADGMERDVNDRDWDVSLMIVFRDQASHDTYQKHPRHLKFIEEYSALWESVRVFDSALAGSPPVTAEDAPPRIALPDPAASFAGMIRGKVSAKRDRGVVVQVQEVVKTWRHNGAANAQAMVGKPVLVVGREDKLSRFLQRLPVGESVLFDVKHEDGEELVLVELNAEQRKWMAESD